MKRIFIFSFVLIFHFSSFSQITIDYCQEKAKKNYPNFSNTELLEKSSAFSIANANMSYLPQLSLNTRYTYQSDIPEIDIKLPPPLPANFINFPKVPKNQYQAVLELSQVIFDGGYTSSKKKEIMAEFKTQKASLEVELYNLRERVANLFFGILSIKEQKKQSLIMQKELELNISQMEAYKDGGLANESDLDLLRVENLGLHQRIEGINILEKTYIRVLSIMIGENLSLKTEFEEPNLSYSNEKTENLRPELKVFDSQIQLLDSKKNMLNSTSIPQILAFAQGGYGKPGLNMFKEKADFFSIIGLTLRWNISSFYTKRNNTHSIETQKKLIEASRQTFLFNTNMQLENQKSEIERLEKILASDKEIIILRERIKESSYFKMKNGTMSMSDYIKDINALDMAKQNEIIHKVQLEMAIYKENNLINKKD